MVIFCFLDSPLVLKLQQWVTDHFPEIEELADLVMRQRDGEHPTESNPNFWPAVNGLVMMGRCKEAKNLLNLHSNKDAAPIKALRQLLQSKPDIEVIILNFIFLLEFCFP
jgi:Nup85 Nucleoporin